VKVYQVYNEYRSGFGGEAAVVEATLRALAENGHTARLITKSSKDLEHSIVKRACAFFGGIYNVSAYREMRRLLATDRPDVAHIHGVYPMFSPSVLVACRRAGVPVVMTVHNNNFTCPTWYHLYKGRICEDCVGGREYRCALKNCRDNVAESVAYALRSAAARRFRLFHDNVDTLIALTPFSKARLIQAGFREDRIAVVPNPTPMADMAAGPGGGEYVGFAGRISAEKGADTLLAAAAGMPDIPFRIAGDGPALAELRARATPNVEFTGRLGLDSLVEFYRKARAVVAPSRSYETFALVAVEAMAAGAPVIAARIGGLPYTVEHGVTGLLFEPGDAGDLAAQVRRLWEDPALCRRMGKAGREKVLRENTSLAYYESLMTVYESAIERSTRKLEDVFQCVS